MSRRKNNQTETAIAAPKGWDVVETSVPEANIAEANVETSAETVETAPVEPKVEETKSEEEKREYNKRTPAARINKIRGDANELLDKCFSGPTESLFRHLRDAIEDLKLAEVAAEGLDIVAKTEARKAPDPEKDTGSLVSWNSKIWKIKEFRKERKGYTLVLVLQDPALPQGFEMVMEAAMSQVSLAG